MNILSLFDGMSCGQLALQRAGIKVDNYYASEIDKYAIQVTQTNFPNTMQIGDVQGLIVEDGWIFHNQNNDPINNGGSFKNNIDLLIGGSPCQGFSFAGKQLNFEDPRSKLFFEYVRILKEVKPKYFLLENVRMKKESQDIISEYLGVQPVIINSNLLSAQNRHRLYWVGKWNGEKYEQVHIDQPEDKGILLKDILEQGVVDRDKSHCLDANYFKGTNIEQYIKKGIRQIAFTERRSEEGKRIRKEFMKKFGRDFSPRRAKEMVARDDGKMNCLTATFSIKEHTLIDEKLFYRKLTPIECERLQTVKDNYTNHVSNSQRYKMLGNGWTIDVISHIFKNLN